MSSPLLQPDGRFQRPSLLDGQGLNRFGDEAQSEAPPGESDVLAPPTDSAAPAYQPRYDTHYPHRGSLISTLGAVGFLLPFLLLLAFTNYAAIGFSGALLGIVISLAAVILGYSELTGMANGAIDPAGRSAALLGFRLGLAGLLLGITGTLLTLGLFIRAVLEML